MPEQRPPVRGCHRHRLALSVAEDLSNHTIPPALASRACRLIRCLAFDPDSGACNPDDSRRCWHCPGSVFTVQPDVKKDEPT